MSKFACNKILFKSILLTSALILTSTVFGCTNFMDGSKLKKNIDEKITYNKSADIPVTVLAKSGGTLVSSAEFTKRKTDSFQVKFNLSKEYVLLSWQITADEQIYTIEPSGDFEDSLFRFSTGSEDSIHTLNVEILSEVKSIHIEPVCEIRPAVDVQNTSPAYSQNGVSKDRSIIITFTKDISPVNFRFTEAELCELGILELSEGEYIKNENYSLSKDTEDKYYAYTENETGLTYFKNLQILSGVESVAGNYSAPAFDTFEGTTNYKRLIIEVNKLNPIKINSNESKAITVLISANIFDATENKIPMAADHTHNFKINSDTDKKAVINFHSGNYSNPLSADPTGTIQVSVNSPYNLGQNGTLKFTEYSNYQFLYWDYNPSEIYLENPSSKETNFTVVNESENGVVKAVCAPRLQIVSVTPNNSTVEKNTTITAEFNVPPSAENSLKDILLSIDGYSVSGNFNTPSLSGKTLTIAANLENLISVDKDKTRTVTITIPSDFYYQLNDEQKTKVYLSGDGYTWNYKINENTTLKADVTFSAPTDSGSLNISGTKQYNIGESVTVKYSMKDNWQFKGWKISDKDGNQVSTKDLSVVEDDKTLKLTFYNQLNGITVEAISFERPTVVTSSCSPADVLNGVSKDSEIKITLSKKIANPQLITLKLGDIPVTIGPKGSDNPEINFWFEVNNNQITYTPNYKNLLNIAADETKLMLVTVPASVYYEAEDSEKTKVYIASEGETWKFKVNGSTSKKADVTFNAPENSGNLTVAGNKVYNIGESVNVTFNADKNWQFLGWKVTDGAGAQVPDSIVKTTVSGNSISLKFLDVIEALQVSAECYERPALVASLCSPADVSTGVAKNTEIRIALNKIIENPEEIVFSVGDTPVSTAPASDDEANPNFKWTQSGKTIIYTANIKNLINLSANEIKTLTVTVPDSVYYSLEDAASTHITAVEGGAKYSFRVNGTTNQKTTVDYSAPQNSGTLSVSGSKVYNLGESVEINFEPNTDWYFTGWSIKDGSGNTIPQIYLETLITGTKLVMNFKEQVNQVNVSPVCYERPSIIKAECTPANSNEGVPKDTPIEIVFNKVISNPEDIELTLDGLSVSVGSKKTGSSSVNYWYSISDKTVTFEANPNKLVSLGTKEVKTFTVTIPEEIYYSAGTETKVFVKEGQSYSFRMNGSTEAGVWTSIRKGDDDGKLNINGTFLTSFDEKLSIGQEVSLSYDLGDDYHFETWTINTEATGFLTRQSGNLLQLYKMNPYTLYAEVENCYDLDKAKLKILKPVPVETGKSALILTPLTYFIPKAIETEPYDFFIGNGYNCDESFKIWFNTAVKLPVLGKDIKLLSRDGVNDLSDYFRIDLEKQMPTDEYLNYAGVKQYDLYNSVVITPKNKVKELVPNESDLYDFKVAVYILQSKTYQNWIDEGKTELKSWYYRVNGQQEKTEPELEVTVYRNNYNYFIDTNVRITKELIYQDQNFSINTIKPLDSSSFWNNHINDEIFFTLNATDNDGGITKISIYETQLFSSKGTSVTVAPIETVIFKSTYGTSSVIFNDLDDDDCRYKLKTFSDGIIKLQFVSEDYAGNTKSYTCYVIKDTIIDQSLIKPNIILTSGPTGNYYYYIDGEVKQHSYTTDYTSVYYKMEKTSDIDATEDSVRRISNTPTTFIKTDYPVFYGKKVKLYLSDIKDTYFDNKKNSVISFVEYKEDETEEWKKVSKTTETVATYNSDGTRTGTSTQIEYFEFERTDTTKNCYLKYTCYDRVNNKQELYRTIPGEVHIDYVNVKESGNNRWLVPHLKERYDREILTNKVNALKFGTVFFWKAPDGYYYTTDGSRFANDTGNDFSVLFANSSIPNNLFRPSGNYKLCILPFYEYAEGRYFGQVTEYDYEWKQLETKSEISEYKHGDNYYFWSFGAYPQPAVKNEGFRTVILKRSNGASLLDKTEYGEHGIIYYKHKNKDSVDCSAAIAKGTTTTFTQQKIDNKFQIELKLESGYYYDILFYCKGTSGTHTFNGETITNKGKIFYSDITNYYVLNVDLTEDNTPPYILPYAKNYMYRYTNYPNFIRLTDFTESYKLYPRDDTGLYLSSDSYMHFEYTFKKKIDRGAVYNTMTISNFTLDDWNNLDESEIYELDLPIDSTSIDFPTAHLPSGNWDIIIKLMDNIMKPGYEDFMDEPEFHDANACILSIPFSRNITYNYSTPKILGTSMSNYQIQPELTSDIRTFDYLILNSQNKYEWVFGGTSETFGSNQKYWQTSSSSKWKDTTFIRTRCLKSSNGYCYSYSFICPQYQIKKNNTPNFELYSKSFLKTNDSYQIFSDGPVLVQMMGINALPNEGPQYLKSETIKDWENLGYLVTNSIKLFNKDFINGSFTYNTSNIHLPSEYKYYRPIFYFADGTIELGDIIYK